MAKKKKAKAKPKAKRKAAPKKKPAKAAPKKRKGKSGGTEVEKRWAEYWRCRRQLEEACDTVREAQGRLSEALQLEQERRSVFEETKAALEQLLEVAPPTPDAMPSRLDLVSDDRS